MADIGVAASRVYDWRGYLRFADTAALRSGARQRLAGGLEPCLACDLIVASEDTVLGIPESTHALVAVAGGPFRPPKTFPPNIAMELARIGKPKTAAEFHRLGRVNHNAEWTDTESWTKQMTPVGAALASAEPEKGCVPSSKRGDPTARATELC
jgi:hypothetical protein